ncbi:MAG: hypothetical protein R2867_04090 [Caldilineaceae bacterium]
MAHPITQFDTLVTALRQGLKQWHTEEYQTDSAVEKLYLFRLRKRTTGGHERLIFNQLVLDALDQLQQEHPYDALLIRKRFLDGLSIRHVANQQNVAESSIYPQQRAAIKRLATVLLHLDQTTQQQQLASNMRCLPHKPIQVS